MMRQIGESDEDVIRRTYEMVQKPEKRYELMQYWCGYQEDYLLKYKSMVQIAEIIAKLEKSVSVSKYEKLESGLLKSKKFLADEECQDATLHFILRRKIGEVSDYIYSAFAEYEEDRAIFFDPYEREILEKTSLDCCTSDEDLFIYLENGYEIMLITAEGHMGIWYELGNEGINKVCHKEGLDLYLDYCRQNHISADILATIMNYTIPDLFILAGQKKEGTGNGFTQEKQLKNR